MTILKYGLLRNFRSPISTLASAVAPIAIVFGFANVWRTDPAIGVGILAIIVMMASYLSAGLVLQDRIDGSVIRVMVSPVGMFSYVLQNILAAMIPAFVYVATLAVVGFASYNWGIAFAIGIAVTMLLFAFTNIVFTFFLNSFFNSKMNSHYAYLFVVIVMAFLCGLLLPREALPAMLQHVGAAFYPYWLLRGVNSLVEYGMTFQFWLYQLVIGAFAIVLLLIGGRKKGQS